MNKHALHAFFGELIKLGAVSQDEAERAMARYQKLKESGPTTEQAVRYGAVGAVGGAATHALGAVIEGNKPFNIGAASPGQVKRNIAARLAVGAVGGGLIPIVRHHLDQQAELGKVRDYLDQPKVATLLLPKAKTPAGMLSAGRKVGTFAHHVPNGPSIAQMSKPTTPDFANVPGIPKIEGWGKPMAGTTKAT